MRHVGTVTKEVADENYYFLSEMNMFCRFCRRVIYLAARSVGCLEVGVGEGIVLDGFKTAKDDT